MQDHCHKPLEILHNLYCAWLACVVNYEKEHFHCWQYFIILFGVISFVILAPCFYQVSFAGQYKICSERNVFQQFRLLGPAQVIVDIVFNLLHQCLVDIVFVGNSVLLSKKHRSSHKNRNSYV